MSATSPVLETAAPAHAPLGVAPQSGPTKLELETKEQYRWMLGIGLPVLGAAIFVGLLFGTGQALWIGPAIALIIVDILVIVWLAMSSDTNGDLLDPTQLVAHHH